MMKNKVHRLFVCLIICLISYSCNEDKTSYTIHGKLENVKGDVFFAARESGDSLRIDTIQVNNKGEFKFTGTIDTLTVVSLYFKEGLGSPYILVDKGWNVEIKGDVNRPDLILAKGGNINDDLTKFKTENIELIKSWTQIVSDKTDVANSNVDSVASKETVIELKNVNFELLNVASEYIKNNPTKIASVMLINNFFKNEESFERLTEALGYLQGIAYDFPITVQLREYRDKLKKSAVGVYAPPFRLKDLSGKEVSLVDFREKYVLLIFESTTCGICTEVRPHIIKEYDILKKEKMNIEFISIIKDIEDVAVSDSLRKEIKWTILPEYGGWSSQIFENYNIKEIPYSILLSRDGKILERDVTVFNLKNQLEAQPGIKDVVKRK